MPRVPVRQRPHVVIAGAGVGGVESALALRELAGDVVAIELVAPAAEYVHRPMAVVEPFRRAAVPRLPLSRLAETHRVQHRQDELVAVDAAGRRAQLSSGASVPYDALIVATGARPVEWLPGAVAFTGSPAVPAVVDILDRLERGDHGRLVFTAPDANWTLPLYELPLLTSSWCADRGVIGASLVIVTPEPAPLAAFGPAASRAARDLLSDRGIELVTGRSAVAFDGERLRLGGGADVSADAVLALPRLLGEPVPGLPADPDGFIPVDEHGRVDGLEAVYAVGDATQHPVKQGGLASQQADAAAADVAHAFGAPVDPAPYRPVLRGLLLTGLSAAFLRADRSGASTAAFEALWWPPSKVAGRYLAPYLDALPSVGSPPELTDREPAGDPALAAHAGEEARRLALEFAEADAAWGDFGSALQWLRAVERRDGVLSPQLVRRRDDWEQALRSGEAPAETASARAALSRPRSAAT